MKLKVRNSRVAPDIGEQILTSRGVEDVVSWVAADSCVWFDEPELLCPDEMDAAASAITSAILSNKKIAVVVDCDVDGYTSSSILCSYLWDKFLYKNIQVVFHKGKVHGLTDTISELDDDVAVVVLPDAGTNDVEEHRILHEMGVIIICLDHHEQDAVSDYAIVVNNQINGYGSTAMTGVCVTYLFIKYFERYSEIVPWICSCYQVNVDDYLDLVALGCLSDMADYRDGFVRHVVSRGLSDVHNEFFRAMCDKQKYSMDKMGGIVYMSCAFYVTPYMNAVCRTGTMEEKEMMFKAMTHPWSDSVVKSIKRGHVGEEVRIVDEAVYRLGKAKERQTDIQNSGLDYIQGIIQDNELYKNAVIVACCDPDEIDPAVCGLVANKLQSQYQKPVLVLRDVDGSYKGSARNYSMCEIEDFKTLCESSGCFDFCAGHQGAFGLGLPYDKYDEFIEFANGKYSDVPKEPVYYIDYMLVNLDFRNNLARKVIFAVNDMKEFWGQQIPEAKVGVRIPIRKFDSVNLIGKTNNTIKATVNGIDIIKFKTDEEEYKQWTMEDNDEAFYLVAYCSCSVNEYNGNVTPQLIVEDSYIEQEDWVF